MRILGESWFWLPCMVAVSAISTQAVHAQPPSTARSAPSKVGSMPVADVLQRLGAKLERGSDSKELDDYSNHFDRTDPNRDGKHTREEYVDKGGYMTPQARAGIFRAADGNADGVVTKAEYVLNRVITDEAKAIVQGMDDDKDGLVERTEFVKHAAKLLSDPKLADQVYAALDANADGGITIPEYLRVWGQWARFGQKSAEERIAARRAELADVAKKPGDPISLFDGKSFQGWEGNLDAFRIEDGAIVGGSLTKPVPRNDYLCSKKTYADFELRLKFKVLGEGANAGIQIRSERVPDSNEMIGYQADLGDKWWGCLYDERRHELLTGPPEEQRSKIIRRDDWNEYVIRCQGRRVQLSINGRQTVDYTEPDESIPQVGVVGLQIHVGSPSEAWYKDIELVELPPAN